MKYKIKICADSPVLLVQALKNLIRKEENDSLQSHTIIENGKTIGHIHVEK